MGIYIKGMDMPECCARCELCQDEMYCKVTGLCVDFSTMYDKRMDNCPLVEIPEPHGRLIDADMAYQETMKYGNHFRKSVLKTIENMQTVIERSNVSGDAV